jgi:hypothetical protein
MAERFLGDRAVIVGLLAILVIYGVEAHARSHDRASPAALGDQGAYLGYARHLYESNYTVTEDRNRMPVYPFLLSLIYRPGMTDDEFLVRAQRFTVNLSVVLLLLLFFILRRFFPPWPSLALLATTAFGVFIYRAGKAQVELLFYFVSFCAFVLLLQMFVRPRWWLAVLAGATTGLAHLTKASVLPALLIWTFVFGLLILWHFRARPWRSVGLLLLVLGSFLVVVFPYIQTSKRIYDAYFYNVNSTFVIWCDSSSEAFDFLATHGDKDQWREVPPEERPSFRKYWREHSAAHIARRIGTGAVNLATRNLRMIGYYKFVLFLLILLAVVAMRAPRQAREFLRRNMFAALFCILFLAAYYLLYAWYDTIVSDARFVLSSFLPFLFAGSIFVLTVERDRMVSLAGRRLSLDRFFAGLFLSLAAIDAVYNATGVWS